MASQSELPDHHLDSERGFLEVAGREADRPLHDLVSADMDWCNTRKRIFRRNASIVRIAALVLTAASTVVLGIQEIPARASVALPMVALVTVLGGLETFFNWRSRWVLVEETRYRFNRLRDEMDHYIVATPTAELDRPPQSPEVRG
jgi:hypothetical protein